MRPIPAAPSDGIGLTDEQYADVNRQVEAGYLASQGQFNDQLQPDLRQQQFQFSLQRDIERGLSNNPEMFVNLPVPRAEFELPSVRPPAAVSTGANPAGQSNFSEIMREAQRTGRTMEEVMLARELRAAEAINPSQPNGSYRMEQAFGMFRIPQGFASAIKSVEEYGVLGAIHEAFDNPVLAEKKAILLANAEEGLGAANSYPDSSFTGIQLRMMANDQFMAAGTFPTNNLDIAIDVASVVPVVGGAGNLLRATRAVRIGASTTGEFVGPLIGRSGFTTSSEFAQASLARYQRYVDEAYGAALVAEAKGLLRGNPNTRIGDYVDRASAARYRRWLASEGITEGPGSLVQTNRWLRDPAGSGSYVRPDIRIPSASVTLDAAVGLKWSTDMQIMRFRTFSGGDQIVIVRPQQLGGSYSIVN